MRPELDISSTPHPMTSQTLSDSDFEPWARLPDKVVLVTGASSGLGKEFCLDLAKAGCRIVAVARRIDRLQELCGKINSLSSDQQLRAVAVQLDVSTDGASIDRDVQTAWDVFGRVDVLVNNAGVRGDVKSSLELSEVEWNRVIRTNLTGAWLVAKSVCCRMRDAAIEGSVINISSTSGLNRGILNGCVAYASSKAALNTITKAMALELGMHKIRVNSICPGIFKSEITEGLMQQKWLNNVARRTLPLGEYGLCDPALTSLIRYLIHDSSSYVTGNMFVVDSGATLPGVPIFSSL